LEGIPSNVVTIASVVVHYREFRKYTELQATPRPFMVFQELEAFRERDIRRQEVVNVINASVQKVLEVRSTGDDILDPATCALQKTQVIVGEVRKDLDE